jgi:aldose 1-epimerase
MNPISHSLITDSPYAPAKLVTLENAAGLRLQVITYGATWVSCSLPLPNGERREVVLGCSTLDDYLKHNETYCGAIIGRFTNRLGKAQFPLDGELIQLVPNEGANMLHAGANSVSFRDWDVVSYDQKHVTLSIVSPDGDQGFPGEVKMNVTYAITDELQVAITFEATTDKATPVSMTHHAYFNLDGDHGADSHSIIDHELQVASSYWLPVDAEGIPLGDFESVEGRGFDLRAPRTLAEAVDSDPVLKANKGFDHCYALNSCYSLDQRVVDVTQTAAVLSSSDKRVSMSLSTDLPSLQAYNGAYFGGTPARDGSLYKAYAGIALEPQFAPDSPKHAASDHWRDCILRPGQLYKHHSIMRFSVK